MAANKNEFLIPDTIKRVQVKLFYRDGANYKFTPEFIVDADKLRGRRAGEEVEYDTDLGISMEEFHDAIGYKHNEDDHNQVTIEGIELL